MPLKIKMIRSAIKRPEKQRRILQALGLTGIGKEVTMKNDPSIRGMVKKVIHLVSVSEVGE